MKCKWNGCERCFGRILAIQVRNGTAIAGKGLRLRRKKFAVRPFQGAACEGVDRGGIVQPGLVGHASHESRFVHQPGHSWEVFADVQAWDAGLDRLELAANLRRAVRLHVVSIDVARATVIKDQNAGFDWRGCGLGDPLGLGPP